MSERELPISVEIVLLIGYLAFGQSEQIGAHIRNQLQPTHCQ